MSITLTPAAVNHLNVLISSQGKTKDNTFVRVALSQRAVGNVVDGSEGSLVTGLYSVNLTEETSEQDWTFDAGDGLKVVAEKSGFETYNGLEVDFSGGQFLFKQPIPQACGIDANVSSGCGCSSGACATTSIPVSTSCGTRQASDSCGTCG